ncbi:MAG TPA: twin-arginine translocation signal domain-containing protein [Vicinamibacterales bacterium]|nr:twin-arginine translocation signal domain-containing protein [Vicinamibacterales bacterium]
MKTPSRRTFLKAAAGVAAGTVLSRPSWAQSAATAHTIDPQLMITPKQALEWHLFKAQCGPTYAGSAGWKRFTDLLTSKIPEFGGVDLDYVDIPYDHYIVEDWPDRRTHMHDSPNAVEKLITDGVPVPVVASYGMTSGSTPRDGITARMLFYDPAHPPSAGDIAGKILVFETAKYPQPPYSNSFLDNYTLTDYEWRSPGKWHELFVPPPTDVTTSYHTRWVWSQLGGFATIATKNKAAGMVVVYDLSPAAAFGLTQRSVYTANCPTLTLDRVNGAKVIADAKAGKPATLTLIARFQKDAGKAIIAHLPGKHYGTPRDEHVLIATHTDAMSLVEENGGFGLLGIMSYWNQIPRAQRARTLMFYFDCRHFMPGGESAWPQYDYYTIHPERLKSVVATMGVEHMGGRQTIEVGDRYEYSKESPEDGGVITSLMDVYNNNMWLVEAIARAATANRWPRVDVKAGNVAPGVNGGFQGSVKSPMNKGRAYKIPGLGLAGDWPGAWTQTFSQVDTEAGAHGLDEQYFVRQVAGLTQLAGELMLVHPRVIDLGWGTLKSAIVKLEAANRRRTLDQYVTAFRHAERGDVAAARTALKALRAEEPLRPLVDGQLEKI